MGGIGSGRRWQFGAETTEDYKSVDVRWLKREGMLEPGSNRRVTWSRRGEVVGSIVLRAEADRLHFDYKHRSHGSDWKDECYPVALERTPCNKGGERPWFRCPAQGCGRRVAILYGGTIFACRRCYRLAYPSQRETPYDRAARKADRIRNRLNWPGGILEGGDWGKPKGMHWKTYRKLCCEHDELSQKALAGIMNHLQGAVGRMGDIDW